jgi:serine/threonine-protein kinase
VNLIGMHIGSYVVERELGSGGAGTVYACKHTLIDREVAVKVLHDEHVRDPDQVARFFQEAKAAAEIGHPNIIVIIDYGTLALESGPRTYVMMESLDGESLDKRMQRGGLSNADVLHLFSQICSALIASHGKGIVHRDLKPSNIFLCKRSFDPLFVKILDFGTAKLTAPSPDMRRTQYGVVIGTPAYMSPEQCEGKGAVDHRSDIYSLGCMLYELLTGTLPFDGTIGEILVAHRTRAPEPPRARNPEVPPEWEALCLRMLEKSREARFQSVTQLAHALDDLRGHAAQYEAVRLARASSGHSGHTMIADGHGDQRETLRVDLGDADAYLAAPGTGAYGAPGTGAYAAVPGTGAYAAVPGTGAYAAVPGTGAYAAAPGTGAYAAPGTGAYAAPGTGAFAAPGTGAFAAPETGAYGAPGTGSHAAAPESGAYEPGTSAYAAPGTDAAAAVQAAGTYAAPGTGAYGAPGTGAYGAPGTGAYGAPGTAAYGAPGTGAYGAPGTGAYGAPGTGAYGAPGTSAYGVPGTGACPVVPAAGAYATPATGAHPAAPTIVAAVASGAVASKAVASKAVASGAVASGAVASGAVASGAVASGAVASGLASGAVASGAVASGAVASGAVASGAVEAVSHDPRAGCHALIEDGRHEAFARTLMARPPGRWFEVAEVCQTAQVAPPATLPFELGLMVCWMEHPYPDPGLASVAFLSLRSSWSTVVLCARVR